MKNKIIVLTAVFLIFASLPNPIFADENIYVNADYGLKFSYPQGWQKKPVDSLPKEDAPLLLLEFVRPGANSKEMECSFTIEVMEQHDPGFSLTDYAEEAYKQVLSKSTKIFKKPTQISLNGNTGIYYEINMEAISIEGFSRTWRIKSMNYMFFKHNRLYSLAFMGDYAIYERERKEIEKAVNSLIIE